MSSLSQAQPETQVDPRWRDLYKIGAVTTFSLFIIPLVAVIGFFIWPYIPGEATMIEIFDLVQTDPIGAAVSLDVFVLLGGVVSLPLFVVLYITLREVNPSYALVALAFGVISVAAIIPVRPIMEIFALGNLYADAETPAEQSRYLAAGEALIQTFHGTAWLMYILLGAVSLLISATLMLRSPLFTRSIAYLGIVTGLCSLPVLLPTLGVLLLFVGTITGMVWNLLMARRFYRLGWQDDATPTA